jgi:hypothetical protein
MRAHCECGTLHPAPAARVACQDCGTTCCRSCAHEIQALTLCRWCAAGLGPARAA